MLTPLLLGACLLTVLLLLCAFLFVTDALARRQCLSSIERLERATSPVADRHLFLVAGGVELDESVRRAASAWATARDLDMLELLPARWEASAWLWLTWVVAPAAWRRDPFATGFCGGHAILVTDDLLERADVGAGAVPPVELARRAIRLRRFAGRRADLAITPGLAPLDRGPHRDREVMRELAGREVYAEVDALVLALPLLLVVALLAAVVAKPVAGLVALAAWHLAGAIPLWRQRFEAPDARSFALGRLVHESANALALLRQPARSETSEAARERARRVYGRMLERTGPGFFSERRDDCPMCAAQGTLERLFTTRDDLQHKPGRFTLERCAGCGHVFQNPPLTPEGLAFYYRDFYDGLGSEVTERVFASYGPVYEARAAMVKRHCEPESWLDVGCGHGHFCWVGAQALPETVFDGLDMSDCVEEAERRGWIARSHRGRFPRLAQGLDRYDVVSMNHYLEHVADPAAEIAAAGAVLHDGGHLLIEVPDPESRWAKILGRWWVLWLQPQHLHFVTSARMEALLRENGFRPVEWHRREAHMPIDLSWMVVLLLQRLGPRTDQPWQPPSTRLQRARRKVVWALGLPLLVAGSALDRLLAPLSERLQLSNLYRVLAVKESS